MMIMKIFVPMVGYLSHSHPFSPNGNIEKMALLEIRKKGGAESPGSRGDGVTSSAV
jgi:hypothetical protein